MIRFLKISAIVFLLGSCSDRTEILRLQKEVEAIHDLPMQKLEELEQMKSVAVKLLDAAKPANSSRCDSLRRFIVDAESANEQMFEWMANYKAPENSMPEKEAIIYLRNQKMLAEDMSNAVMSAFGLGKKLTAR